MSHPQENKQGGIPGKFGWYLNRLRCMTLPEISARARHAFSVRLKRKSHSLPIAAPSPDVSCFGQPWFEGSLDTSQLADTRAAARRLLNGSVSVFSLTDVQMDSPPQWNRDLKTGVVAPLEFGLRMSVTNQAKVGDIKYLWEPSRHHDLVCIAQAYALTGDESYRAGLINLLESWIDQCPYPLGPHWISPLEAGIRLINWSIIWHVLQGTNKHGDLAKSHASFHKKWLDSIYWHIHFVIENLSAHSSANNHLLGELAGAVVGLTTWPCWDKLNRRREQVWQQLQAEALLQNFPDGVNREQAISYQQFVFDFLLIAGLSAQRNKLPVADEYWQRLEAMLEFVAAMMDVAGNVPHVGDGDDGAACGFVPEQGNFRSILATGALLFSRSAFARAAGVLDGKTRWILGDDSAIRFSQILNCEDERALPTAFRDGGYYLLGKRFGHPDEIKAIFDAGPLGYLGIAAHGHADALSLLLSVSGEPVLIDPGTYCYHGPLAWREYFRGTEAHNTVTVDSLSQSISGGRFMWVRHANAQCTEFVGTGAHQSVAGSHDGYNSGRNPAMHQRRIEFIEGENRLVVTDQLDGSGNHETTTNWHFGKTITASLIGNVCHLKGQSCAITIRLPEDAKHILHYPTEAEPLGWISERYESKNPGFVLISRRQCPAHSQWVTEFEIISKPG